MTFTGEFVRFLRRSLKRLDHALFLHRFISFAMERSFDISYQK